MTPDVARRLLELNRRFYAEAATDFDATRHGIPDGMARAIRLLPAHSSGEPLRILDVGCGNGRLARALEQRQLTVDYVGLDADGGLLALAAKATAGLMHVQTCFVQADLADPTWTGLLHGARFDAVFCLATLHHFPGEPLRARLLRDLTGCLAEGGWLCLATWQFTNSARLLRRLAPWESIGLTAADVDPGDALLPWDQGKSALRYAHAIGEDEVRRLAAAAALTLESLFYSDGLEGNLNLYALLQTQEPALRDL